MDFRKNLLDLYYYKNLQYKNTVIIILFTYFIGILVAFLTKQLDITNRLDMILVATLSIIVMGIGVLFLNEFNYHLKKIPEEIKKLG
ncbi:MAG: hypothetical protein Q8N63_07890 [Nanoarchaeota archaeon]|nr:hypothetical protein [Nanoarchaeota archaeon]